MADPIADSKDLEDESKDYVRDYAAYQDLFQKMLDPVLILDIETFGILDVNPTCEFFMAMSREDLLGRFLTDWVVEGDREDYLRTLRIAKRNYYPRQRRCQWVLNGHGPRTLDLGVCCLRLSNGMYVLQVIARDVTVEVELKKETLRQLAELNTLNARLEALSTHDEMTELSNFRHFKQLLEVEHERANREGTAYSLVFCDVDHFKKYNDHNGHPAGDELLRTLAGILRMKCRRVDHPARYGGEEFVVVCPRTGPQEALIVAERIRSSIEKHSFPNGEHQPEGRVTVSIGVASYPQDAFSPEQLVEAADRALYESKHSGRNRVTAYSSFAKKIVA